MLNRLSVIRLEFNRLCGSIPSNFEEFVSNTKPDCCIDYNCFDDSITLCGSENRNDPCPVCDPSLLCAMPQISSSIKNPLTMTEIIVIAIVAATVVIVASIFAVGYFFSSRRKKAQPSEEGSIKLSKLCFIDDSINLNAMRQSHTDTFPLAVSPDKLGFGLGTHQAPVGTSITQEIELGNTTKKPVQFKCWAPKSAKYMMDISPASGCLKPGFQIQLTVSLTVMCTTKVDTNVLVVVINGNKPANQEEGVYLPLKVSLESMLSTSLDYDELTMEHPHIGEGSYGIVYHGQWRSQEVAIKVIKNQEGASSLQEFQTEVKILEAIRCPQIVHFVGAVHTPGKLAIVTEFFRLGNLNSCVQKKQLSLPLKIKCLLDCCRGMSFIHQSSLLHRDLKVILFFISFLSTYIVVGR
eukprot:TRINITY_DN13626_c0_g1_i2.p1 TRINITY_DN13626_c0_g1~~TRINITY_DN13626_c0_g1_i2.p1  ORF type:complete len:409 (-),score=50.19 TRINITY_DN13626_c0_g1_i2:488-1714(-)